MFSEARNGGFNACIENNRFSAQVEVSTYLVGSPEHFFADLATHWRGFDGAKEWAELDDHLRLTATTDSTGHIYLEVVMRNYEVPENWKVEATLTFEAGQLAPLARAIERLFQGY